MIIFRNAGTIDPKSITTFGVSSKENPGAIGFFGTGLKYALAILLRHGCDVTIYSGTKRMDFGTKREKVRVDEFSFVTMNGKRLGFTTELGKTWEVWQAFRELYCNCLDEAGEAFEVAEEPKPAPGQTTIVVRGEAFRDVWATRSEIILSTEPILSNEAVQVHPGQSHFVYYRGVRAYRLGSPSMFTYNLQRKVDLTEDRTIKYQWDIDAAVRKGFMEADDGHMIHRAVTAPRGTYEHGLSFEGVLPSETFLNTVGRLARAFDGSLNRSAMEACRIWLMDQLHEARPVELTPLEAARLDKALKFCVQIGYPVTDYPVVVSEFLGEDVLGRAHGETIYVSKRALMMGTKMLAGTLLEEFLHLRHKLRDNDRGMQNFLIDALVSMGEQMTGEPL